MPEITRWVNNFSHFFVGFLFEGLPFFPARLCVRSYQGNLFETHNNNENLREIKDLNVGRKTEMIIPAPPPTSIFLRRMVDGGRGNGAFAIVVIAAIVPLQHFVPLRLLQFSSARPLFLAVISDKRPKGKVVSGKGGGQRGVRSREMVSRTSRHNLHI